MAIRIRLSRILGERRIKQTELAQKAGLTKFAVFNWYHEKNKAIELKTLEKMCKALGCQVGDLLEYVPEIDPSRD